MLEKREERIKLLKQGFDTRIIEMLYVEENHFRIINFPIFIELLDVDVAHDGNDRIRSRAAARCT
jgi:hypothetical protein